MRRARAFAAAFALAALPFAGGCVNELPCTDGTALLTVTYDAVTAAADTLDLTIYIDGGAGVMRPVSRPPGDAPPDTVEIDFPSGYPRGSTLSVVVAASQNGTVLGMRTATITLDASCGALAIDFNK